MFLLNNLLKLIDKSWNKSVDKQLHNCIGNLSTVDRKY